MNYTEKYHLPQWEETDRIMRADFNKMCADMEAGLLKNAGDAVSAVESASANALAEARQAQSTANEAVSAAAAAQTTANNAYSPSKPPYAIGTYKGTGGACTVNVGFPPSFVIIASGTESAYSIAAGRGAAPGSHLAFTNTGFTVKVSVSALNPNAPDEMPPYLSKNNRTYSYIAFR